VGARDLSPSLILLSSQPPRRMASPHFKRARGVCSPV
jgi:hypothetical protein